MIRILVSLLKPNQIHLSVCMTKQSEKKEQLKSDFLKSLNKFSHII